MEGTAHIEDSQALVKTIRPKAGSSCVVQRSSPSSHGVRELGEDLLDSASSSTYTSRSALSHGNPNCPTSHNQPRTVEPWEFSFPPFAYEEQLYGLDDDLVSRGQSCAGVSSVSSLSTQEEGKVTRMDSCPQLELWINETSDGRIPVSERLQRWTTEGCAISVR